MECDLLDDHMNELLDLGMKSLGKTGICVMKGNFLWAFGSQRGKRRKIWWGVLKFCWGARLCSGRQPWGRGRQFLWFRKKGDWAFREKLEKLSREKRKEKKGWKNLSFVLGLNGHVLGRIKISSILMSLLRWPIYNLIQMLTHFTFSWVFCIVDLSIFAISFSCFVIFAS